MLVFNKYLKELGYKEDNFPFGKKDNRYKLSKKYGVVEAQTWDLHTTIILELYTYLRFFQEECPKGIPAPYIDETKPDHGLKDWRKTLQKMIDGLKAYIEAENLSPSDIGDTDYFNLKNDLMSRFDEGWKLIGENMEALWW